MSETISDRDLDTIRQRVTTGRHPSHCEDDLIHSKDLAGLIALVDRLRADNEALLKEA